MNAENFLRLTVTETERLYITFVRAITENETTGPLFFLTIVTIMYLTNCFETYFERTKLCVFRCDVSSAAKVLRALYIMESVTWPNLYLCGALIMGY